jgi:hypothetical protein
MSVEHTHSVRSQSANEHITPPHPARRRALEALRSTIAVASLALHALANHGPGTSGGGTQTASGETLKQGAFDFTLRTDFTQFENISQAEAAERALQSGDFDALNHAFLNTVSGAYGITDDFQCGASIGYYSGIEFISAEADGMGGADIGTANPHGITDLWLTGKYRVMHGRSGNLSLIGGVKLPTGKDDVHLSNGELLEPSSQPGTGAVDGNFGAAYSRFLTSRITIDASAAYTLRGSHDDFTVGDRFDAGVAVAYRLTQDIKQFPNYSVAGELVDVWIGKDDNGGVKNENSGGNTLYVTPSVRTRFNENVALTVSAGIPVAQHQNGDQIDTEIKASAALSFSF